MTMKEKDCIGVSFLKLDAAEKVTGYAKYVADINRIGMLYGKILRSTRAHARILGINVDKASAIPGVRAIVTFSDISGKNQIGMTGSKDQKVFAEDRVRFYGEALAAVAADSESIAENALRQIEVLYEDLPVVETIEQALMPDAPQIGDKGNICLKFTIKKGDCEKGMQEADLVLDGEYHTASVDHAYLEPEAVLAEPIDNGILIYSSTKSVHVDQREIARVIGWPLEKVHVVAANIGGSFGGKPDLALNTIAALLCVKSGMSVTIRYTREESLQVSTKRHPCIIRYTHGIKKNGTLTAVKLEILADTGAYIDYSSTVLQRMAIFGAGPYRVPNVLIEVKGVYTNNPVTGAMRGFGVPQVAFACERQLDRLAKALGIDPFTIRYINCLKDGDTTATGQILKGVTISQLISAVQQRIDEEEKKCKDKRIKPYEREAWGIACSYYGNGRTGMPNPGVARACLDKKGSVKVIVGTPDIGQGSNTIYAQIAASTLGVDPDCILVTSADTRCTPDSGTTSGTRNTAIVGKAVQLAMEKLRSLIMQKISILYSVKPEEIKIKLVNENPMIFIPDREPINLSKIAQEIEEDILVEERYDPPTTPLDENGQGNPYAFYTYSVQGAKVRVNLYTGKISVEKVIAAFDAGTVINPTLFEGQIEGAIAMGIGYALSEEIKLSKGIVKNNNFDEYIIPMSMDMPEIETITIQSFDPEGPFGAKGVGEPAVISTAPAIANAVSIATNKEFFNLPLSLEEVSNVLKEREATT